MPYNSNAQLPGPVREALPRHAQDIFRASFNSAFSSYAGRARREEIAHRVAWAAVKKQYVRKGDRWVERANVARRTARE